MSRRWINKNNKGIVDRVGGLESIVKKIMRIKSVNIHS